MVDSVKSESSNDNFSKMVEGNRFRVIQLRKEGYSYRAIARMVGIHEKRVRDIIGSVVDDPELDSANKKRAENVKDNILEVFERLGSTDAMAEWAAKNQTVFYTKIWARLLPRNIQMLGENGEPVAPGALAAVMIQMPDNGRGDRIIEGEATQE